MKPADFDQFVTMLTAVGDLYGKPPSEMAITLWWGALQQYDLAAVRQGFDRHVRNPDTGQFAPKPADIVKMLQGSTQDAALLAWAKVDRAVREVGPFSSVVFDDPIIHRVLHDMGGWIQLGDKTEKEWPFIAKEFENRYRGYRMRNEQPEYPRVMLGAAEAQNSKNGHESQPPILIGDADAAARVMQGGTTSPLVGYTRTGEGLMRALELQQKRIAA